MRDNDLRVHLVELLRGGSAHMGVEEMLRGLPKTMATKHFPGQLNTPWRILEHIRIAQWDILEFSRDPDHVSPEFPDGYWPDSDEPAEEEAWDRSIDSICSDLEDMVEMVTDRETDIFARIPHGEGQTILREALLVADHSAYHLGQLMLMRRVLESEDAE